MLTATPSHALFGLKFSIFGKSQGTYRKRNTIALAGQKVQVFTLQKGKADDLISPLQNYLSGIHSQGSLDIDAGHNAIIATDLPENLMKLQALIRAMDQPYTNSNAMARRMLATQQMMLAIRTLAQNGSGAPPTTPSPAVPAKALSAPAPSAPSVSPPSAAVMNVPTVPQPVIGRASVSEEEDEAAFRLRRTSVRPALRAFRIVGWFEDDRGVLVVLRNDGQRYFYSHGHLTPGRISSTNIVPGIQGSVKGRMLTLTDLNQGSVKLNLMSSLERIRQ